MKTSLDGCWKARGSEQVTQLRAYSGWPPHYGGSTFKRALVEALADARERIAQLEQQQAAQQAASLTPEQHEDAQRQALLDAIHAANRKGELPPARFA